MNFDAFNGLFVLNNGCMDETLKREPCWAGSQVQNVRWVTCEKIVWHAITWQKKLRGWGKRHLELCARKTCRPHNLHICTNSCPTIEARAPVPRKSRDTNVETVPALCRLPSLAREIVPCGPAFRNMPAWNQVRLSIPSSVRVSFISTLYSILSIFILCTLYFLLEQAGFVSILVAFANQFFPCLSFCDHFVWLKIQLNLAITKLTGTAKRKIHFRDNFVVAKLDSTDRKCVTEQNFTVKIPLAYFG